MRQYIILKKCYDHALKSTLYFFERLVLEFVILNLNSICQTLYI